MSQPPEDQAANSSGEALVRAAREAVLRALREDLLERPEVLAATGYSELAAVLRSSLERDRTTAALVKLLQGRATEQAPFGDNDGSYTQPRPGPVRARGAFVAKEEGVLAGTLPAALCFEVLDAEANVEWSYSDGDRIGPGDPVGTVDGSLQALLCAERTALNLLCHLSGVATLTRSLLEEARKYNPSVVLRDTRKTLPGLRLLEKEAVRAGGAINHRFGLYDGILIKDNHLSAVSSFGIPPKDALSRLVTLLRQRFPELPIEIEADDETQARTAAEAGADVVLCDNMLPEAVRRVVEAVGDRAKVEASGGIGLNNIGRYAAAGVHFIAVGSLTHSAPAVDLSFEITEAWSS